MPLIIFCFLSSFFLKESRWLVCMKQKDYRKSVISRPKDFFAYDVIIIVKNINKIITLNWYMK